MVTIFWKITCLAALILPVIWLTLQVRKPSGWFGKRVVQAMNVGHSAMTDWALQQITVPNDAIVLDIGCGGGRTVSKLAAMVAGGRVVGLDYSAASLSVARETNATAIKTGHVQLALGSVAALPFADCSFDLVTAVETHYYWPNLAANTREVWRVLKPGGIFVLVAEAYRGGPFQLLYAMVMPLLRAALLTEQQHRDLLVQAGFDEVQARHASGKNWIRVTGRRSHHEVDHTIHYRNCEPSTLP